MATDQQTSIRDSRGGVYVRFLNWMETLNEAQYAYLLLIPAFILLGAIAFWPLLTTFEMSLHDDALFGAQILGEYRNPIWANYTDLLTGQLGAQLPNPFLPQSFAVADLFSSALTVTLLFTFISVFFETLIGFGQALVLDQDFSGRRWVRVAIIIPWAVPIVIQGMIFYLMFQPNIGFLIGGANDPTILQTLGPLGTTPLVNSFDATLIVIVADIWKTTAFMALLILAGMQSIDRSLYDVAKVSGATKWQSFKMITFPLILPSVLVAMLFRTIQAMRVFGIIETVSSCQTVPSLSCLVITSFNNRLMGTSATVAFVTAAIIALAVSGYIVRYGREGI